MRELAVLAAVESDEAYETVLGPGPFAVDQEQLDEAFPQFKEYAKLTCELGGVEWSDDMSPEVKESMGLSADAKFGRARTRQGLSKMLIPANQMAVAAAQFIETFDDMEEGSKALEGYIDFRYLGQTGAVVKEEIVDSSITTACIVRELKGVANSVVETVQQAAADNIAAQYGYVKAMADTDTPPNSDDYVPGHCIVQLDYLTGSRLAQEYRQALSDGRYDSMIAADLVRYVYHEGDSEQKYTRLKQLTEYTLALQGADTPEKEQATLSRMVAVIDHWPNEMRDVVGAAKVELMARLDFVTRRGRQFVREQILEPDADPLELLRNRMAAVGEIFMNAANVLNPRSKAEMMRARAVEKRRRNGGAALRVAGQQPETPPATPETTQREALELGRYKLMDGVMDTSEGVLDDLIEEVMSRTQRGNQLFANDLKNMFTYLRNVDFSSGMNRGIKKLNTTLVEGQSVRQLKPKDAVGLPTATLAAKNMRVMFIVAEQGQIGILDVIDRRDVNTWLANLSKTSHYLPN